MNCKTCNKPTCGNHAACARRAANETNEQRIKNSFHEFVEHSSGLIEPSLLALCRRFLPHPSAVGTAGYESEVAVLAWLVADKLQQRLLLKLPADVRAKLENA